MGGVAAMDQRGGNRDRRSKPSGRKAAPKSGGNRNSGSGSSPSPRRASGRTPGRADQPRNHERSGARSVRHGKEEPPKRLEPEIPQEIYREEIDPQLTRELSSLASDNAEQTARHLLAIVHFLGDDPERAHAHGVAASTRAGRVESRHITQVNSM